MTPPAPFRGSQGGRPKGWKGSRPGPGSGPGERRPRGEADQRSAGNGRRRAEDWSRERPRRRREDDAVAGHRGRPRWDHKPRWEEKPGGQRRPGRGEWRPRERDQGRENYGGDHRRGRYPQRPPSPDHGPAPGASFPLTETTPPPGDLVWGRHAAEAVLHSERPVHRVWCTGELRFSTRFMEVLREAKASGVVVEEVSWARLAQLCGGAVHQGIVLQTAAASSVTLKDLLGRCDQSPEPTLLVAVDGITDPHNLGAIARSVEAFGGHGLVAPQRRNAGLTGSVAKVAAGALEHLPVARVVNLNRSLEQLKEAGYTVVGLAGEGGQCVVEIPAGEPLVVVVGSEGTGLSHLTRQYCHQIVRIPLRGKTPHLNAAVACGVVLYEIARQRWLGELHGSMPTPPAPERQPPTAEHGEPEPAPVPTTEAGQPPQQTADLPAPADGDDGGDDNSVERSAPQPDEPTPVAPPAPAPASPSPDVTWSSGAADTDHRLAAHVSL
ncbi:MAG: 23S rRNA (guanosine(2251)-2'-O)-methyltransferase RlmB [Synechococcus sp. SB0675_bin_6]|nr:23S rRNA (guanosine(2251)-2'-O)-methyltransferase RlmB [Synechococcus sp. SB0675_bin_6]